MREPLVTVVMPCYNAARWLEETLASVFAQTHANLEVIAVDDGSKDSTWEILERCADARLQRHRQPNSGAAAARNFALARACGDFVQFLDADDVLDRDKIRIQLEAARERPGKWVLGSSWGRFHGPVSRTRWEPPWNPLEWRGIDWLVHAWTAGVMMPPHGWLVPRAIVDCVGAWNPAAGINDDGEYFARVLLAADGVAQVAAARAHYRSGNASYSQRTDRWAWQSLLDSYELTARHMLAFEDSPRIRHAIGARLRSFQYVAYPAFGDLSARAGKLCRSLALPRGIPHGGGTLSRVASRAIGWKLTRRLGILARRACALSSFLKRGIKGSARHCIAHRATRAVVNLPYLVLPANGRKYVHARFARIFRGIDYAGDPGVWRVRFAGRGIAAPLGREPMWLDWETALSITGHDVEVKETYAAFLRGSHRPDVFIDVGGNYGTHSILFLVHGVETVTFEPNPACHEAFRALCAANGVEPGIVAAALGSERGSAQLSFPEGETWLGSISEGVTRSLRSEHALRTIAVERATLDDRFAALASRRVLMKIDAEGSELDILAGGREFIRRTKPYIVFESWPGDERRTLFDSIAALGYGIHALPFDPDARGEALSPESFIGSSSTNFIAVA